jgi:hypothetical protein
MSEKVKYIAGNNLYVYCLAYCTTKNSQFTWIKILNFHTENCLSCKT